MNRIRYRQRMPKDCPAKSEPWWNIWGFDAEGGFVGPLIHLGTYPESFQSTRKKDKEDTEVWRGSIIRWDDDIVSVVVWDDEDGSFDCMIIGGDLNGQFCGLGDVELYGTVIGNTVENPDLMREVEK